MNTKRFAVIAWAIASTLAVTVGAAMAAGIVVNTSDSMPVGLWKSVPSHALQRGDVVRVCLPASAHIEQLYAWGYFHGTSCGAMTGIIKPVAAVAGDIVTVAEDHVTVNGHVLPRTGRLAHDGNGHRLPHVPAGRYTVAPGKVWLVSTYNSRSLDSRYFGPLPVSVVQSVLRPVWVDREQLP